MQLHNLNVIFAFGQFKIIFSTNISKYNFQVINVWKMKFSQIKFMINKYMTNHI